MKNGIDISVIIPTFNRKEYLKKAISALLKQTYPHDRYEIIVVDDYSTDATQRLIEDMAKASDVKITYYANNKAKGQTIARNIGFQKAKGEYVASTDDDMEVSEDWLVKGLSYFRDSDVSAVEGRVLSTDTKTAPFYHNMSMEGSTYGTGNIFYRKAVLDSTGGLDEHLNQWHNYGSHYELGLRILDKGGKIVYGSDVVAHHPSFKMKASTIIRNSLKSGAIPYLYKKHGPKITSYLGFRRYRILITILSFFLICSFVFLNYPALLLSLFGLMLLFAKFMPGFTKSGINAQVKTFFIYNISCFLATLFFLYGCVRYGIFPDKKIFRM